MTFAEFLLILEEINSNHKFAIIKENSKHVKYVYPVIDMRNKTVISVKLRCFSGEKVFAGEKIYQDVLLWLRSN